MTAELSAETISKLKARAANPATRTDMAAMGARSIDPLEMFAAQRNGLGSRSPEHQAKVRAYLEGMNTPLSGMISNAATGDGSQAANLIDTLGRLMGGKPLYATMGGQTIAMTGKPKLTVAMPPVGNAAIAWAEAELGFTLPTDLKAFYTEVANGGVGPGDGIFTISDLVRKRREMDEEPAGPQGQPWPSNLLPILGSDELFSIDLDSGRIIYWDFDELDIDEETPEDDPSWERSFKVVAESLETWLGTWVAEVR